MKLRRGIFLYSWTKQQQQLQLQKQQNLPSQTSLEEQEEKFLKSANEKLNQFKLVSLIDFNLLSIKKHKIQHLDAGYFYV